MKTVGLCTHFTETDEWAFAYAYRLARTRQLQLNICHWLRSPYTIRRDIVYSDLFNPQEVLSITPEVLNNFELLFRQYYEPKLGDFTDVAFKLCEGAYQVELVRCFRQHLLDMVVMGYQSPSENLSSAEQPMELFAINLPYPVVIVGIEGPETFLVNEKAFEILDQLDLPQDSWRLLQDSHISWRVLKPA